MKPLIFVLACLLTAVSCEAWELDQHAKAIDTPLPVYPAEEKSEAKKAVVSVLIQIDDKGKSKIVRVMSSSSYRFADVARKAAIDWKFKPGRRDGKPSADLLEFVLIFDPEKQVEVLGPLYE